MQSNKKHASNPDFDWETYHSDIFPLVSCRFKCIVILTVYQYGILFQTLNFILCSDESEYCVNVTVKYKAYNRFALMICFIIIGTCLYNVFRFIFVHQLLN